MLNSKLLKKFHPLDTYGDTLRVSRILSQFTFAIFIGQVIGILAALSNHDVTFALIIILGIPVTIFTFMLVRREKFELAVVFLSLFMFSILTVVATLSLGIHNISNLGFPALLIVASMVTRKRTMIFLTLYAVACAAWLCFGELAGAFTPQVLVRSVPGDFVSTAMLIILTAFMSRFLSENLFQNNFQLRQELAERQRAEEALRASEQQFKTLVENTPDIIARFDRDLRHVFINQAYESMVHGSAEALLGKSHREIGTMAAEQLEFSERIVRGVFETRQPVEFETSMPAPSGTVYLNSRGVPEFDEQGQVRSALFIHRDITERKHMEEQLRARLEEREALLREVHHRVKNNLQAIIALIKMQSDTVGDAITRQFLMDLEGRARTMSLVYEQLYQSENLSRVNMQPYLQLLTSSVLDAFGRGGIQIKLDAPIFLDVTHATPCGLIVNELFTNILKHAFPPGYPGAPTVTITMRLEGDACHLTVSDNGMGLPPEPKRDAGKSLGLRLVRLWATHQLGGTIRTNSDAGTMVIIVFDVKG